MHIDLTSLWGVLLVSIVASWLASGLGRGIFWFGGAIAEGYERSIATDVERWRSHPSGLLAAGQQEVRQRLYAIDSIVFSFFLQLWAAQSGNTPQGRFQIGLALVFLGMSLVSRWRMGRMARIVDELMSHP